MRGAHALLSPNLGAPATPAAWQTEQTFSYVALPSPVDLTAVAVSPPPGAAAATAVAAGAMAVLCLPAHSANFAGSRASTTMGMKACSLPHNSAHCPRYVPGWSTLNQAS